jgi:hypothetical protein
MLAQVMIVIAVIVRVISAFFILSPPEGLSSVFPYCHSLEQDPCQLGASLQLTDIKEKVYIGLKATAFRVHIKMCSLS